MASDMNCCSHCHFQGETLLDLLNHNCMNVQYGTSQSSTALYFVPEGQAAAPSATSTLYFVPEQHSLCTPQDLGNPSNSTSSEQLCLDRWEDKDVKLLITSWLKHKKLFGGKSTKKDIFQKIADSFNETSHRKVTGEQCLRKFQKLVKKQKEVEDHNKLTGRDPKTWKYHKEMSECLQNDVAISPPFTIESSGVVKDAENPKTPPDSSSVEDSSLPDSESGSDDDVFNVSDSKEKKVVKRQRKKPKGKSSASEMLEFLKDYSEKREKAEQEKLQLFKEMKEEKKSFFDRFFNMMDKKS